MDVFIKLSPLSNRTCLRGRESEKVQILIINYSKTKIFMCMINDLKIFQMTQTRETI